MSERYDPQALLAEHPDPVLCVDDKGVIIFANKAATPLLRTWQRWLGMRLPRDWLSWALNTSGRNENKERLRCGDKLYALSRRSAPRSKNSYIYAQDITVTEALAACGSYEPLQGSIFRQQLRHYLAQAHPQHPPAIVLLRSIDEDFQRNEAWRQQLPKIQTKGAAYCYLHGGYWAVALPLVQDEKTLRNIIEHWVACLQAGLHNQQPVAVRAVGVLARSGSHGVEDWLARAFYAYEQVQQKKLRSQVCTMPHNTMHPYLQNYPLQVDLSSAIAEGQLRLDFQPQVALTQRRTVAFEALLRWQHPKLGVLYPKDFAFLAEQQDDMVTINMWAVQQVCGILARMQARKEAMPRVAINMSMKQLQDSRIYDFFDKLYLSHKNILNYLEVEISESGFLEDTHGLNNALLRLKKLGVSITIDDFGTGCVSSDCLQKLPVDKFKINSSFIADIKEENNKYLIVNKILNLGKKIGVATCAEGVESHAQVNYLRAQGCDHAQGFYFGKPTSWDNLCLKEHGGQYGEQAIAG